MSGIREKEKQSMVQKRYNIGLDFIRIFSMLAVIWVHLSIYLPVSDKIRPLFAWGGGQEFNAFLS